MKKITEKDLSLDKQVVSTLSGVGNNIKNESDYCTESGVDDNCNNTNDDDCLATHAGCHDSILCNLTNSAFEICCDATNKNCPPAVTMHNTCVCPATGDTMCDDCSIIPGCLTPIPETQHC